MQAAGWAWSSPGCHLDFCLTESYALFFPKASHPTLNHSHHQAQIDLFPTPSKLCSRKFTFSLCESRQALRTNLIPARRLPRVYTWNYFLAGFQLNLRCFPGGIKVWLRTVLKILVKNSICPWTRSSPFSVAGLCAVNSSNTPLKGSQ